MGLNRTVENANLANGRRYQTCFILLLDRFSDTALLHGKTFSSPAPGEIKVSWNNSLRYNWGMRMQACDPLIADNAAFDQSDALFDLYDTNTNRLDWLSELPSALSLARNGGRLGESPRDGL